VTRYVVLSAHLGERLVRLVGGRPVLPVHRIAVPSALAHVPVGCLSGGRITRPARYVEFDGLEQVRRLHRTHLRLIGALERGDPSARPLEGHLADESVDLRFLVGRSLGPGYVRIV